mmetsp:Transcript_35445/g.78641  ORF Transcript_35445/g.78641 Transcript_35445/m.78641 type:complete len:107 (+) Transcript_35445:427-747(+)
MPVSFATCYAMQNCHASIHKPCYLRDSDCVADPAAPNTAQKQLLAQRPAAASNPTAEPQPTWQGSSRCAVPCCLQRWLLRLFSRTAALHHSSYKLGTPMGIPFFNS